MKPSGAVERERYRMRWRAFLLPHWPRMRAEVLSNKEAAVLSLRLGLVNDRAVPQRDIARRFDCSPAHVGVLEHAAMAKVRTALKVEDMPDGASTS